MATWLYQMTSNDEEPWHPAQYRLDVWEGKKFTWNVGKIYPRGQGEITPGDIGIFFFSTYKTKEPGIYGWGIAMDYLKSKWRDRIAFEAVAPSDYLKMTVCWNPKTEALVNKIRGKMKQGTAWGVKPEELTEFRKIISAHMGA